MGWARASPTLHVARRIAHVCVYACLLPPLTIKFKWVHLNISWRLNVHVYLSSVESESERLLPNTISTKFSGYTVYNVHIFVTHTCLQWKCDPLRENLALPTNIEFKYEAILSVQVVFQLNSGFYTNVLQGACTVSCWIMKPGCATIKMI